MAIRYIGSRWLYTRTGGSWVSVNDTTGKLNNHSFGGTFSDTAAEWWWLDHVSLGSGVWNQLCVTDKFAPNSPPSSISVDNTNGTLGRNNLRVFWSETSNPPLPLVATAYDLEINYLNTTDTSHFGYVRLTGSRSSPYTGFVDCGADGDLINVTLNYIESSAPPGFSGPSDGVAGYTLV